MYGLCHDIRNVYRRGRNCSVTDKLNRVRQEAVLGRSEVLFQHLSTGTEENREAPLIEYQYPSQDLNPGFREQRQPRDLSTDTELLVSHKSK